MSIEQTIAKAVSEAIHPDKIKAIIEPQIEQMMTQALGELFKYRGQVTVAVEEAIKGQMKIDPRMLNFTSYNAMMIDAIHNYMADKADADIAKLAKDEIAGLFSDPPAEIRISELITKWMEEHEADPEVDDRDDFYEIERNGDSLTGQSVSITFKSNGAIHDDIYLYINREKILSVTIKDWANRTHSTKTRTPNFELRLGCRGFEREVCQMYAAGTRVIDDE